MERNCSVELHYHTRAKISCLAAAAWMKGAIIKALGAKQECGARLSTLADECRLQDLDLPVHLLKIGRRQPKRQKGGRRLGSAGVRHHQMSCECWEETQQTTVKLYLAGLCWKFGFFPALKLLIMLIPFPSNDIVAILARNNRFKSGGVSVL